MSLLPAVLVTGCASTGAPDTAAVFREQQDGELDGIAASVGKVLPADVRLLSVRRDVNTIVLDFSDELLAVARGAELEDTLHRLMGAASSARTSPRPRVEDYRILINGVPLENRIP